MIVKMPRKSTGSVARSRKCYVHLKTVKKDDVGNEFDVGKGFD